MKRILQVSMFSTIIVLAGLLIAYPIRQAVIRDRVKTDIQNTRYPKIENLGSTKKLMIIPIFENAINQENLIAGTGVAYLVKTDHANILFDLGFDPDTLQNNMQQLEVSLEDIDIIFISHNHPDHVGGHLWWPKQTFSLEKTQPDLGDIPVYVPEAMTYPGLTPVVADKPRLIAEGVASMGVIPFEEVFKPAFRHSIRYEQALAINVDGAGILLISGCGHPGIQNMLNRAKMLFDVPVVGIVGGLHYKNQNMDDLNGDIQLMQSQNLRLLAISPHDSAPATIQIFRDIFSEIYEDIAVGHEIIISGSPSDNLP